ncbi:MAG: hypothetical protein ACOX7F_00930 [Eubacteriales bacterium]
MQQEGVTESLKAANQMAWGRSMTPSTSGLRKLSWLSWSTVERGTQ